MLLSLLLLRLKSKLSSVFDCGSNHILQDNPEAKLEDLDKPGVDDEPQQVLLR